MSNGHTKMAVSGMQTRSIRQSGISTEKFIRGCVKTDVRGPDSGKRKWQSLRFPDAPIRHLEGEPSCSRRGVELWLHFVAMDLCMSGTCGAEGCLAVITKLAQAPRSTSTLFLGSRHQNAEQWGDRRSGAHGRFSQDTVMSERPRAIATPLSVPRTVERVTVGGGVRVDGQICG